MSQPATLNILGDKVQRLPTRRRGQRRSPQMTEVTPGVIAPTTTQPLFGCAIPDKAGLDIMGGSLTQPVEDIIVTKREKEIMQAQTARHFKNLPTLEIETIKYDIISNDELRAMSRFTVTNKEEEGLNTINDPRGGVVDNGKVCQTCNTDNLTCPGHFGIIELNEHIIHPMFRRDVIDVLTSVCNSCGGLLLTKDFLEAQGILELSGSKRLRAIADASKNAPCRRPVINNELGAGELDKCTPNPKYIATKANELGKIVYTYGGKVGKDNNIKTVAEVEQILDAISNEDAETLGFSSVSHPRRFIMKSLPVIPICARAPVFQDGEILKDDISSMYLDIVNYNLKLKDPSDEKQREDIVKGLTFSIEHLFDNSDGKYGQGKTKVYQDIKSRIQGKEAIIRNLIQGKRVNYSARTVLGPDPNLKFGQIRVPEVMAPFLTYPETVSSYNRGRLTKLLRKGRITHITYGSGRHEGKRSPVSDKMKVEYNLNHGDSVDRWLQDGDFVAFNRQPTLHKQGLMGYEVVLGKPMTIGLHLAYTSPHNADFDGDEGTLHAPQSREAMLELAMVMNVKKCIMNAQTNNNIISVVMDALAGSYMLTQPETFVDEDVFSNIVSFIENKSGRNTLFERLEKYNLPKTSGRALFSSILPEDFYYRKNDVLIREGILISGVISKENLGSTHGSIIQVLMKDYDEETTVNFLTDIYNIIREWLDVRGFSVGLDDCILVGDNPEKSIKYEVERAKMLVRSMGWKLDDPLEEERREKQIISYLNGAKSFGARISDEILDKGNAYNIMAKSGSKGSTVNIAQITGILGQQFVQGQRMPETISGGRRCLPYFPEDSLEPAARGFCVNSFLTGLSPAEMFYHQAGGREGLTDTAIKTAESGSIHHRMVKALEDVKVYNDGSVRNSSGSIFQYAYGEDGFDASLLETVGTSLGTFTSFINTKRLAGRINARYGYSTPGDPEPEVVVPIKKRGATVVPAVEIGNVIRTGTGNGTVQTVDGDRVLVDYPTGNQEWIDLAKGKFEEQ